MYYIIDRWEGDIAVCEGEDGAMVNLPRRLLPAGSREGAKLRQQPDGAFCLVDNEADRVRIRAKLRRLFAKKPSVPDEGAEEPSMDEGTGETAKSETTDEIN